MSQSSTEAQGMFWKGTDVLEQASSTVIESAGAKKESFRDEDG